MLTSVGNVEVLTYIAIEIREVGSDILERWGELPSRFCVWSTYRIEAIDHGLGGIRLTEEKLDKPFEYNYDGPQEPAICQRASQCDVSNWGFFARFDGCRLVGWAVIAPYNLGIAELKDIRVHPDEQRKGIGRQLFGQAAQAARARNYKTLEIVTQNVNVGACKFYDSQGCCLRYITLVPELPPHQARLVWRLDLSSALRNE